MLSGPLGWPFGGLSQDENSESFLVSLHSLAGMQKTKREDYQAASPCAVYFLLKRVWTGWLGSLCALSY